MKAQKRNGIFLLVVTLFVFSLFSVNALTIGNQTTYNSGGYNYTANRDFNVTSINISAIGFYIDNTEYCSWENRSFFDTVRDCFAPNITYQSPDNETSTSNTAINFTGNFTDDINLSNATLWIYNETGLYNSTTVGLNGIKQTAGIVVNLVDGVYHWFWKVFDKIGHSKTSQNVTTYAGGNYSLTIDTIAPNITIVLPTNTTYNDATQLLKINSDGDNIWYNWNGTNYTYTSEVNITFNEGLNTIYAWANDTAGNLNYTNVSFTIISLAINIINPTNRTYYINKTQLLNISSNGDNIWYNWNGTNYTYTSEVNITFNEGLNTIYAWANDTAGNLKSANVSFTIVIFSSNCSSVTDLNVYGGVIFSRLCSTINVDGDANFLVKKNNTFTISLPLQKEDGEICTDCLSYITIRKNNGQFLVPISQMQNNGGYGFYQLNESQTSEVGVYQATVRITDDNNSRVGTTFFTYKVTPSGLEEVLGNKGFFIGVLGLMIIFFLVLAYTFRNKWKIKMFFEIMASLFGIILLNVGRILANETYELGTMGDVAFYGGMAAMSFLFLYLFIYYMIEIFGLFKKKNRSWNIDEEGDKWN